MRPWVPLTLLTGVLVAIPCPLRAQDEGGKEPKKERPKDDGGERKKGEAKEPKRFVVGDDVKDLAVNLAEGGNWNASAARGKGAVLVFAAAWSAESLEALKRLGDPKGKVSPTGAEILGVLRDAGAEKAKKAAQENGITVRLAVDPRRKAYDRFARSGLPYTVVLDRAGKVALSAAGFDEEAVAKVLEEPKK